MGRFNANKANSLLTSHISKVRFIMRIQLFVMFGYQFNYKFQVFVWLFKYSKKKKSQIPLALTSTVTCFNFWGL